TVIVALADLLGRDPIPLDADAGEPKPKAVAVIDENECIGCTLCLQACPVDAIVGAAKQMHTVVAELCTGCELCMPPCPVECIHMEPLREDIRTWRWPYPEIDTDSAREATA
ncbi:MAG TPA: RnfABCDGE type electron transport complex subunit B, partial [Chromatiales bacterium]|nr:RnfABCDGE type electron transport complex subunit B [Chromatiales bacterium]